MISVLSCYQTLDNTSASLPSLPLHRWDPLQDTAAKLGGGGPDYSVTETRTTTCLAAHYARMREEQRKEAMITRKMLTRLIHLLESARGHPTSGPPSIPGLVSLAIQPRGDSLLFSLSHPSQKGILSASLAISVQNHTYFTWFRQLPSQREGMITFIVTASPLFPKNLQCQCWKVLPGIDKRGNKP